MVIEGFIEEELLAKIDTLERCFIQSFTQFDEKTELCC